MLRHRLHFSSPSWSTAQMVCSWYVTACYILKRFCPKLIYSCHQRTKKERLVRKQKKTMSVNVVHQALARDDRDIGRGAVVSSAAKPIDWNTNSSFLSKWIWWWWIHLVGRRSKPFNTVRYRISPGVRSGSRHDELGYVLGCRYGSKHADEVHRWILVFAT